MIPSVVATQLQDTLVDYILATLAFDDPDFAAAFEAQLRGPDGLFRGPYLKLGLPFRVGEASAPNPLTVRPPFPPYAHQLQAFQQLHSGGAEPPRNTLVTTGTGSGKTECFLYPILDHCFRNAGQPGVQAILIYPMNALATDQARRLAKLIHGDERLRGTVRAGLYVGGGDDGLPSAMGPDHLIENKQALRNEPPHILLTNYKMLDFMLLRPDERRLWQHNGPETLRYLVVDELHTFDGAQGSDVGCLIRRLKTRLKTPAGHLACAGTSATIGSATGSETFAALAGFARQVFDEPFEPAHIVREQRVARAEFLREPDVDVPLPDPAPAALDPEAYPTPAAWLTAQQHLWLGEALDPLPLGAALTAHPLLGHLLAAAAPRPTTLQAVDDALAERVPGWADRAPALRQGLLASFLALVSAAKRDVDGAVFPLLTVQVQLWSRELTRLLRALPDQEDGALAPPRFAWWTDAPGQEQPDGAFAPQAHCRECGIAGLAIVRTESDRQRGTITVAPGAVGEAWLRGHRDACFVWPRPLNQPRGAADFVIHWLDPEAGHVHSTMPTDDDGTPRGGPVVLETRLRDSGGTKRFAARCPACGADDALSIVGARAASLTSVAVTQLFQSPINDDKKLLAFTDSVQDACHRAGFFGGRTFRIHLRTAMQAVIDARDPLPLADAAQAFEDHWRPKLGDLGYLAAFLPHDLRELPEYLRYVDTGGKGKHERIWRILRERLGWEFTREFGVAAAIGRSLENSAASTVQVDPARLQRAADAFTAWYAEQAEARPGVDAAHFLRGLLHRMRHMGAIHHAYLERYVRADGNTYLLSKRKNPYISPQGPRTKRIRFVSSRPKGEVLQSPFGRRAGLGWFGDWARRGLRWPDPGPDALASIYGRALAALTDAGVLTAVRSTSGTDVWGLAPEALRLTRAVGAVRSGPRGRLFHVARADAEAADGQPSWAFRAGSPLAAEPPVVGYYAAVYNRGETTRVFPGEHTGLLTRESRTDLESRFLRGRTPEDPQAPNLLVATPTLEMGVDIGDLSAAMLCSVPPTPANYLQRIGRAGRKTGNALVFVLATAQAHDLYFHADPLQMLDGAIEPPGVFLGAVAMLRRQLSAWCMDHWARDDDQAGPIPRKASLVLGEAGRKQFPGRLLEYVGRRQQDLLDGFLARFGGEVGAEGRAALAAWLQSEQTGLAAAFDDAFDELKRQIDGYRAERDKAWKRIKQIEADPTAHGDPEQEIRDLKRYRATLGQLIDVLRGKYPLNVLADASLLPNYAFPEAGVTLHSRLGADEGDEADGKKKRTYEKREYVRPASQALRELAPFNTFYAEGHKVVIRELDLGPKAARVQHWRFCPTCHYRRKAVDPTKPATEGACPRCGEPHWADKGQVRAMLPMNTVRSVADRVRSTTADDTDERARERFHLHKVFDVRTDQLDGEAVVLPDLGFGFEYLREVTLTEVNLGLQAVLEGSPKVKVAGESASALGFPTCRDCGTVRDPRTAGRRNPPPEHSPFCPQRNGDTKPREELYLFREVRSEAVRFLLPFSEVQVEPKLRSFQAAVSFGLRRKFGGQPMHLEIATMTEPAGANRDGKKHFLVLFDSVPGGTGYLREYRSRKAVFDLLESALEGLRSCGCRTRGRDGCYLCLFGRQSQRHLPVLSSRLAEELLDKVLRNRHTAAQQNGGLSDADVATVLESELEEKFIAALQVRYGDAFTAIGGGDAWELRAGESIWRLEPQQWLTEQAGEPMRSDFVFTGVQGPALNERVVVECDGYDAHVQPTKEQGRVAADLRKRSAVAARPGWRMFQLTWQDVTTGATPAAASGALVAVPDNAWSAVFKRASKALPDAARPDATRLPKLPPLDLLCAYLEQPGEHWGRAVAALLCARLGAAAQTGQLVDGHGLYRLEDHLRTGQPLTPLPPAGLAASVPKPTEFWGVVDTSGDLAVLLRAKGKTVRTFDPAGIEVLVRLDDRENRRKDEAFAPSWRSLLHTLNLAWLLPGTEALTDEGLDLGADDGVDVLAEMGLMVAADSARPVWGASPALADVLASCFDDAGRDLVRAVHGAGLPLPDVDRPELAEAILPDLAWSELQLAVVHPDSTEPEDIERARKAGWTVLQLPLTAQQLTDALRNAGRPR